MIKIKVEGKSYRVPSCWGDISLAQCAWLEGRAKEMSNEQREYYRSYASADGPQEAASKQDLIAFNMECVAYLSGAPLAAIQRINAGDMLAVATAIMPRFVCGVLGYVDYTPSGIGFFRWRTRRYLYPKVGVDIMGTPTPLSGISAIELCQLSDIIASENMALAPLAVAICCRPKGEAYNEQKAQQRAAQFAALPASVFWEVWVLLSNAHKYLRQNFPECYGKGDGSKEQEGKAAVWSDILVGMAVGKPSELSNLQKMNGYDFVHLMAESAKQKTEEWKMNAALSGLKLM